MNPAFDCLKLKASVTLLGFVCLSLLLCGCQSLPKNLPVLLDKSADSLETEKTVSTQALKSIAADVSFTKKYLEAAREALAKIDATNLSVEDKQSLKTVQGYLDSELRNLGKVEDTATSRAVSLEKTLSSAADVLRLTHGMVEKNNARELLVKQLIEKITDKKKE